MLENFDTTFLVAQGFGVLGIVALCLSYLSTTKVKYLLWQIICTTLYSLQYFFLSAFSAAGINVITIVKSVAFFGFEKKEKPIPLYALAATLVVTVVFGVIVFDGTWTSVMPIVLSCFYTYGTWQKNLKITYAFGTVVGIVWLVYNFSVGAYVVMVGNVFEIATSVIGFYKLRKMSQKATR